MSDKLISRRSLVKHGLNILGITVSVPLMSNANPLIKENMNENPEPIKAELIKEFVGNAHGNLDKVTELITLEPNLLNASYDWGGGDFETALNAAGHMGRKDIAEFLLSKGARVDIFCAAMLGKLEVVTYLIEAYPSLKKSKGPHGLSLLHHARQGGEDAKKVLEYLTSIGAS